MPEEIIRIVSPATWPKDPDPATDNVVRPCGRCKRPVWYNQAQAIPVPGAAEELVCVPCALHDPVLRPDVIRMWLETRAAHQWAEGTL